MSGPAQHSTHLPEPSGPTDERFVYHLTDEGRRVLAEHEADTGEQLHLPAARFAEIAEAAEREQRRQRREALAEQAKSTGQRIGTISYRWKNEKQFPLLRLSGDWLAEAGFPLGQLFRVTVSSDTQIPAVDGHPDSRSLPRGVRWLGAGWWSSPGPRADDGPWGP